MQQDQAWCHTIEPHEGRVDNRLGKPLENDLVLPDLGPVQLICRVSPLLLRKSTKCKQRPSRIGLQGNRVGVNGPRVVLLLLLLPLA